MAKKRRWSRYVPPRAPRDEDGLTDAQRAAAAPAPAAADAPVPAGCAAFIVVLIVAAVIALVVTFALGSSSEDDDRGADRAVPSPTPARTDSLEGGFVERALRTMADYRPGSDPFAVHLDGTGLSAEFYVAADDAVHRVRTSTYEPDGDIYGVSIEDDHIGFAPTPFDLDLLRPEVLVEAAESALARIEDPADWFSLVEVARDTTEPTITTWVWPADETGDGIRVVTDLDGAEISAEVV